MIHDCTYVWPFRVQCLVLCLANDTSFGQEKPYFVHVAVLSGAMAGSSPRAWMNATLPVNGRLGNFVLHSRRARSKALRLLCCAVEPSCGLCCCLEILISHVSSLLAGILQCIHVLQATWGELLVHPIGRCRRLRLEQQICAGASSSRTPSSLPGGSVGATHCVTTSSLGLNGKDALNHRVLADCGQRRLHTSSGSVRGCGS